MANVVGSFNQGVGVGAGLLDIANRAEDRAQYKKEHGEDRERQKVLQQREDVRWQQGLEDRAQNKKEHESDLAWQEKSRGEQEKQWDRNETTFNQNQAEYNHKQQLLKRQEGFQQIYLPALDKAIVSGDFSLMETPEFQQYVSENPQLDVNNILGSDTGKALGEASQLLREASEGNLPKDNDPRLLNAVDKLFPEITQSSALPKVYTTKDGKSHGITGRRISGVHVMDNGSFTIQQELQLDNGDVVKVPVTQNRSSSQDDNVMLVPMNVFTDRMHDIVTTQNNLSATQLNKWRQLQTGRSLSDSGDGVLATNTKGRKGKGGGGGSSSSLTKQQLSEQADINKDFDEQIANLQAMGGDDVDAQVDKLNQQRAEALQRHTAMYMPLTGYDPQKLSREQAEATALRQTKAFVDSYPDYEFDAVDKANIQKYLVNNPRANPSDVNKAIQLMIEDETVSKRSTGNNASDFVKQARSGGSSGTRSQPQGQSSEGGPKYGGEIGVALPGYEKGEGLGEYAQRQGSSFVDWANEKQSQLQQALKTN
ncbi:hypothetical protein LC147_12065 [Vibrio harveyi]|uniref:hypothetical protein n=1 Tax=Vibrio harveyi TaxID=669 RepID=UPI003BB7621F